MRQPLNLARRPFRNERLPTLVLLIGLVVLLGLSVRHALAARDLLPERTSGVDGELVALEQKVARLRTDAARLRTRSASDEALREWAVIRDLVDRRAFSWSELLGRLEEVAPPGIRLVSIAPAGADGEIEVAVTAVGESVEDGLELLQALQNGQEFKEPFLSSVSEASERIDFAYTMIYEPGPTAAVGDPGEPAVDEEHRRAAADREQPDGESAGGTEETVLEDGPEDAAPDDRTEGVALEDAFDDTGLEGDPEGSELGDQAEDAELEEAPPSSPTGVKR